MYSIVALATAAVFEETGTNDRHYSVGIGLDVDKIGKVVLNAK